MRLLKVLALVATLTAGAAAGAQADPDERGPHEPKVNFNAVLRPAAGGPENGFGKVKFRQPEDADVIAHLRVRLRRLAPNHGYYFQRAVDPNVDDICTGTNWLSLGKGPPPEVIMTNDKGKARTDLWRDLRMFLGTKLDIHFRVIDAVTSEVVLQSRCYQFVVSQ